MMGRACDMMQRPSCVCADSQETPSNGEGPYLKAKLETMRGLEYPGKGSPSSGFVGMFILMQLCQ